MAELTPAERHAADDLIREVHFGKVFPTSMKLFKKLTGHDLGGFGVESFIVVPGQGPLHGERVHRTSAEDEADEVEFVATPASVNATFDVGRDEAFVLAKLLELDGLLSDAGASLHFDR
jgi:hypothetical protein